MTSNAGRSRKWLKVGGAVFLVLAASISYFAWRARDLDDFARKWVLRELSERFQSQVELGSVRVTLFPLVRVTGEKLVIHFHDRMDVPPLVRVDKFQFHIGLLGFLRAPEHIRSASLQHMTVSIPPRALNKSKDQVASTHMKKALPAFVLDELVCDDVDLVILPKNPKKEPLDWVIHRLIVRY